MGNQQYKVKKQNTDEYYNLIMQESICIEKSQEGYTKTKMLGIVISRCWNYG